MDVIFYNIKFPLVAPTEILSFFYAVSRLPTWKAFVLEHESIPFAWSCVFDNRKLKHISNCLHIGCAQKSSFFFPPDKFEKQ
jgi:hypothetical protein